MRVPFKICPSCSEVWQTRDDFLNDSLLHLNGYKADFKKLEYGLFFFTHQKTGCYSTLALEVADFLDLHRGTSCDTHQEYHEKCSRSCREERQSQGCEHVCECAFAREVCELVTQRREKNLNVQPVRRRKPVATRLRIFEKNLSLL